MAQNKNIIITGANKGIGLGIVKCLAKKQHYNIIMACRDVEKGQKAKEEIKAIKNDAQLQVMYLDVSKSESIENFVKKLQQKNLKIDILVNNAGVAAKKEEFESDILDWTFKTNFYGTNQLTEKMLPIIIDYGKIITIGSNAGRAAYKNMKSQQLQKRWRNKDLKKEQLFYLMKEFKQAVEDNTYAEKSWPKSIYGLSKLGINLYTCILSKNKQIIGRGIQVYCCCPGYVNTDMTSHHGTKSVEQGIKTPCYLIELPSKVDNQMNGCFFEDEKVSSTFE